MTESPRHLVVASGSPRRHLLLSTAGFEFDIDPPDVDETPLPAESPTDMVQRLALDKARAVSRRLDSGFCVLGVDTIVVLDGDILGKPVDAEDAVATLLRLSDNTHTVYSGFAAVVEAENIAVTGIASSLVVFRPIEAAEARAYVATGEPLDRAGSYAIQGRGGDFIIEVAGTRSNVMGLPVKPVVDMLSELGVVPTR